MGPGSVTVSSGVSRYRRRRPLPALVILVVLGIVAVFVWAKVLHKAADVDAAIRCNSPGPAPTSSANPAPSGAPAPTSAAPAPKPGQVLPHDALDRTDPAAPGEVSVRVFNGSTQRNVARFATTTLTDLGFKQAGEPDNDPVYPAQDLNCRGQIRFGANGAGAARTLSLVEPCTELVRDDRQDATVDLALGKKFDELKPSAEARRVLDELTAGAAKQPAQQGGQLAEGGHPTVSSESVQAARDSAHCGG